MKHVFVINPTAGKKRSTRALVDSIQALDVPYEIAFTEKTGDAWRIAQSAAESGEDVRIYACGGDGTLNEVVNGAAGFANAAVTNVPLGTGNDFLKIFGRDNKARFSDLRALLDGPQAAMDLIDCNGRLGIDIVCTGVDARIAVDKDTYKALPPVSGMGAYILSLVVNVLFKHIAVPTVVDCGDLHYEAVLWRRVHAGGGQPARRRRAGDVGGAQGEPPDLLPPGGAVRQGGVPPVSGADLPPPGGWGHRPGGEGAGGRGGRRTGAGQGAEYPPVGQKGELFLSRGPYVCPRAVRGGNRRI